MPRLLGLFLASSLLSLPVLLHAEQAEEPLKFSFHTGVYVFLYHKSGAAATVEGRTGGGDPRHWVEPPRVCFRQLLLLTLGPFRAGPMGGHPGPPLQKKSKGYPRH